MCLFSNMINTCLIKSFRCTLLVIRKFLWLGVVSIVPLQAAHIGGAPLQYKRVMQDFTLAITHGDLTPNQLDFVSFFIPILDRDIHHIRWETGTIFGGSSLGYRQTPRHYLFDRTWFWGSYLEYKTYPVYGKVMSGFLPALYRCNFGVEGGISRVGQLTFNGYWIPGISASNLSSLRIREGGIFSSSSESDPIHRVENKGCSLQLTCSPLEKVKVSPFFFLSSIWSKGANAFQRELVHGLGISLQVSIHPQICVFGEYVFCGKYQKGNIRFGILVSTVNSNLQRDIFQGYLSGAPERRIISYLASNSEAPSILHQVQEELRALRAELDNLKETAQGSSSR
jgi:hypothetical protein